MMVVVVALLVLFSVARLVIPSSQIADDHWSVLGQVREGEESAPLHISSGKTSKQSRIDRC